MVNEAQWKERLRLLPYWESGESELGNESRAADCDICENIGNEEAEKWIKQLSFWIFCDRHARELGLIW